MLNGVASSVPEGVVSPAFALVGGHGALKHRVELANKVYDFIQLNLVPKSPSEQVDHTAVDLELLVMAVEKGIKEASVGLVELRVADDISDVRVL